MSYSGKIQSTNNIALDILPGQQTTLNAGDYLLHIRKLVNQIEVIARNHIGAAQFVMDLDSLLARPEFSSRFKLKFNAEPGMRISYSALFRNQVKILDHTDGAGKDRYMDLELALSGFVLAAMIAEFHQSPCDCLDSRSAAPAITHSHQSRKLESGNYPSV